MALVAHKYMVDEMPVEELRATFAAREHTLDYLVKSLRAQTRSKTLTSYLITGPRGAGKTTIVRMLCLRIGDDPELRAAWLPVRFPEEIRGVSSLRDLLAATLERLAQDGTAQAQDFHARVQAEMDEEQSQELAIGALRRIASQEGKRLILFVENLDQVFERALDKRSEATLRRLLMVEPFMMVVGTAVHVFDALKKYDQALFNYFCPSPLGRLDDQGVHDLLYRRAEFDGNAEFAGQYERHMGKIQALTRLTGGNPRLIMMLYEVLSHGDFTSVLSALEQLVDELTPLLKDILDHQFSTQQSKILDALMRAGGTATPAQLAKASRISLNNVTRQLQRLKDMQVLEVLGGGKGHPAHYTVPDQLFCTWYQMRYLRPHRRRIELFVQMLRVWFDEEQRAATARSLAARLADLEGKAARDGATALEYYSASLTGTPYAAEATDLVVAGWLRVGNLNEAAMSLAEAKDFPVRETREYEAAAYAGLGQWAWEHGDLPAAVTALRTAIDREPANLQLHLECGVALGRSGDHRAAFERFDHVVRLSPSDALIASHALLNRGVSKHMQGDTAGAVADYTGAIELEGAPKDQVALALFNRGVSKGMQGDPAGAIADYTAAIELEGALKDHVAYALVNRGISKGMQGDTAGEIADYTALTTMRDAPGDALARALLGRAIVRERLGEASQAFEDELAAASHGQADRDVRVEALQRAFRAVWRAQDAERMDTVSQAAADGMAGLSVDERTQALVALCQALAQPEMRDGWPRILRSLLSVQTEEVAERLRFLLPVAEVLETGDPTKLNPLPPEQRAFAQEVLRRFSEPGSGDSKPSTASTNSD